MSKPGERFVMVDFDNYGEPYVCRQPLLWINDPRDPKPLSTPQRVTMLQFLKWRASWAERAITQPELRRELSAGRDGGRGEEKA